MNTAVPVSQSTETDSRQQAAFMAGTAFFTGAGLAADRVYSPVVMVFLSAGLLCCLLALISPRSLFKNGSGTSVLLSLLFTGIAIQFLCFIIIPTVLPLPETTGAFKVPLVAIATLTTLWSVKSSSRPHLRLGIVSAVFLALAWFAIAAYQGPAVDVYLFQHKAAKLLLHGTNPFDAQAASFPNIYGKDVAAILYGQGVVDHAPDPKFPNGKLTYGFPYLPASLLLIIPGVLLGDDPRYCHIGAIMISAILMALVRPGRFAILAATLFLFTPKAFFVVILSWTEPLLILGFSLSMFAACRYPRLLPYALGLFLSTKQYAVLSVPLFLLLIKGTENPTREFLKLLSKAVAVATVLTLPFVLWNFHAFWHSVVEWQFVQPFRADSFSYLVTIANLFNGWQAPVWTSLAFAVLAIVLVLRRGAHTPAGFATGVTFVFLLFFLFNKQAFSNYYYFVIATACWAVATAGVDEHVPTQVTTA